MIAETASNIEIVCSNLILPGRLQFLGSVSDYESYQNTIGADGWEITPTHSKFARRLLAGADFDRVADDTTVEHQSQQAEVDPAESNALLEGLDLRHDYSSEVEFFGRAIKAVHSSFRKDSPSWLSPRARLIPTWRESLSAMRRIQQAAQKPLSAVLYTVPENRPIRYDEHNAPFHARGFQPKPYEFRSWGLDEGTDPKDLGQAMEQWGFNEVVWDVFHAQGFDDPEAVCERLSSAGMIQAIHLSIGRLDVAPRDSELSKRTTQALKAFMHSPEAASKTLEGEMLTQIIWTWRQNPGQTRRIVLEQPPRLIANSKKTAKQHRAIIETTRAMIEAA